MEHKIRDVLFAGVSTLAVASSVYGETKLSAGQPAVDAAPNAGTLQAADAGQTTPAGESTTPAPAQAPAESAKLEEITVTGSRLIRSGLDSPTPITAVAVDDLAAVHPGTLGSQLNDLPIFDASRGQSTNAGNGSLASSPTAPNPSAN